MADDDLPEPHDGMTPEEKGELLLHYAKAAKPVAGMDFSEADLFGEDLSGTDLSGVVLNGAILHMATLDGACLRGVGLEAASLGLIARDGGSMGCAADYETYRRSEWTPERASRFVQLGMAFDEESFPDDLRAHLFGLPPPQEDMTPEHKGELLLRYVRAGVSVAGLDFSGADIYKADLREARLQGAQLQGAKLAEVDLGGADLSGADLTSADLLDARLNRATLLRTSLVGADMSGTFCVECRMEGCDLTGATLMATDLRGVDLRKNTYFSAVVNSATYAASGWTPEMLQELRQGPPADPDSFYAALRPTLGIDLHNLDEFPPEAQQALLGAASGLTLTFDARVHRAAPALVTGLILEVLGPESDVGVEQQSRPSETPGFIRINGSDPADLILVAEAFYARLWDIAGASPQVAMLLTELRETLDLAAMNHSDADEWVRDLAEGHRVARDKRTLATKWRRLLEAIGQDNLDRGRKLIGKRTFDTTVEIGGEIVADVRAWWERRQSEVWERRVEEMEAQEPALLEDQGSGDDDG